jgi:major membrane immunogen (membrane-anchored lipoprotein)
MLIESFTLNNFLIMKKTEAFLSIILLTVLLSDSLFSQDVKVPYNIVKDTSVIYKDGKYEGKSRAKYIYEPFWGNVHLTIKNGLITDIDFIIRDSNLHEIFDGKYEKHFEGNAEYIQQSRNDWKGVQTYPIKLSEKQDINKLDAISGATWSYNIFRASVKEALKDAK